MTSNPLKFRQGILAQLNLQLDRAKQLVLDPHHRDAADRLKEIAKWRSIVESWNAAKAAQVLRTTSKRAPRLVARAMEAAMSAEQERLAELDRIFGERGVDACNMSHLAQFRHDSEVQD